MKLNNIHHLTQLLFSAALIIFSFDGFSFAQTDAELTEASAKAAVLLDQNKYREAAPYLEKLAKASPNDADIRAAYGVALLFGSKQTVDPAEAKKMSDAALVEFQAAKKLGSNNPNLDAAINLLTGKTSDIPSASNASPGDKYFQQAEAVFAQSKYDEAIKLYQKALDADPKFYDAALYIGDCYVSKQDWDNAEKSYQKAIAIDPNRETAYRYSATPFMKQKNYDTALDRYIEAYITDPYNKMASGGISQWANVTGATLGHPKVDIPKFGYGADGKAATVMNETSLKEGSKAWLAYSLARDAWHKQKFAKTFPNEKTYRHSLQEEADAIRETLKSAKEQKLSHPHFDILQKLDSEGLLEAY
ncbi:MAG: tetratricopeptide repeat protein, partial [Acidobacteriota bacterium]